VEVKVLDVGSEGILGLLGIRRARVRVSVRQEARFRAARFLEGLLERMGLKAEVNTRDSREGIWLDIAVEGDGGILIGHRGQTLEALQLLAERSVGEDEAQRRIIVDVNSYLRGREERLVQRAQSLADKAVAEKRSLRTEPLAEVERRIVHQVLRSDARVESRSVGAGMLKPILIAPKGFGPVPGEARGEGRGRRRDEGDRRRRRPGGRRRGRPGAPREANRPGTSGG